MSDTTKTELLDAIKCILEVTDADLSWDQLPHRSRIQDAIKFINTLIVLEQ